MYIARDKNNILSLYFNKPIRMDDCWSTLIEDSDKWFDLPEDLFPELKWKDEPIEVIILPIATEKDVAKMIDSMPIHCRVCSNYHCDDCEYSKNKDGLNLKKLDIMLDNALAKETKESYDEKYCVYEKEQDKHQFKTREHAMMHHLKNALDIAEDGSNLFSNDSLGCSFCREVKEMIENTMERIQKDIDDYHITE